MTRVTGLRRALPLVLVFAGGVVLVTVLALVLAYGMIRPALGELLALAGFLAATATVSIATGYGAHRLGWFRRSPRLSWSLLGDYALASLLTFLNVGVTALPMFTSGHDLALGTVLLAFASGIAIRFGYFYSAALMTRLDAVNRAAASLAEGQLDVCIDAAGQDEIAGSAATFNHMAACLQQAAQHQEELDRLQEATRVEVEDTGEGIAPDDLPHVFERFYRREKSRSRDTGGTGPGLAIARVIIEAHCGRIAVESANGLGTRVWFDLPD